MAIIRRLELQGLEVRSRHSEAECTYSVVEEPDGKYLQVDTYGSKERMIPGKKSQSIRFSPTAIEQLRTILSALTL